MNVSVDRHIGLSRAIFLKLPISFVSLAAEIGFILADSFLGIA